MKKRIEMNERIIELAIEAGLLNCIDGELPQNYVVHMEAGLAETKKFAELIANECADICDEMATKCAGLPDDGALARDCAYWIKKDFGIEE